ncbi:MAG: nucleotidyltransferase domain-containing protein [archaeon]
MQKAKVDIIKKLFAQLTTLKYIKAIYISGSAARKANVKGSDIDINIVYDNVLYSNINLELVEMLQNNVKETSNSMDLNLHIQPPKALSDFWDLVRSGEPWILTELESALVLYDPAELIEPLKTLLKKHQLYKKHERAAILIDRAKIHFHEAQNALFSDAIIYLTDAAVSSTQAILMYFNRFAPNNELPDALKKFVREGLIDESHHKFLVLLLKLYNTDQTKRKEYCSRNKITLDNLIDGSLNYLEKMEELFELLESLQKREQSLSNYNTVLELVSMITNNNDSDEEKIILAFESEVAKKMHHIPTAYITTLKRIIHIKHLSDEKRFAEISSKDIYETSASLKYMEKLIKMRHD